MKERIEQARREYARIPKYGYVRPPKELSDEQLVHAFYHEDLQAIQRIPCKADMRTLRRVLAATKRLLESTNALMELRVNESLPPEA